MRGSGLEKVKAGLCESWRTKSGSKCSGAAARGDYYRAETPRHLYSKGNSSGDIEEQQGQSTVQWGGDSGCVDRASLAAPRVLCSGNTIVYH